MKKSLLISLLFASVTAFAGGPQHYGYQNHSGYQNYNHGYYTPGYYNRGYRFNNWVAPAIVGGMIGYGIATSPYYAPGYYAPPPVYIEQPPQYVAPVPVYETVWSPSCRCYRTIPRY